MKKVVVASAPWCQNCKLLKKSLVSAGVEFEEVNIDKMMDFARNNQIRSLPTTLLIEDDNVVEKIVGVGSIGQIKKFVGE